MRMLSMLFAVSLLLASAPAMAGRVAYADGQGRWVPSACEEPRPPAGLSSNPSASASSLNTEVAAHNAYADAAAVYMDCVSKEAQRDADTMSQMIINSAQAILAQTQAQVERADQMSAK